MKYRRGITFGAFDPLHYGHIKLFERAKLQCRHLTVCVSSDDYIRHVKNREPYIGFNERVRALNSIRYVDVVLLQDTNFFSKEKQIKNQLADVVFVGDDWTPETFGGEGLGVPVVYLPRTKEIDSTTLREDGV